MQEAARDAFADWWLLRTTGIVRRCPGDAGSNGARDAAPCGCDSWGRSEGGTLIAHYRSYLVRVWTSAGHRGSQWAGRVECIQNSTQQRRFHDPDTMLDYLSREVREDPDRSDEDALGDRCTNDQDV